MQQMLSRMILVFGALALCALSTGVSAVTPAPVVTIDPDIGIAECMRLCTHSRIRHLPVVEDGRVIGVVSLGDLVKAVIDAQAEQIEQLERYIIG